MYVIFKPGSENHRYDFSHKYRRYFRGFSPAGIASFGPLEESTLTWGDRNDALNAHAKIQHRPDMRGSLVEHIPELAFVKALQDQIEQKLAFVKALQDQIEQKLAFVEALKDRIEQIYESLRLNAI